MKLNLMHPADQLVITMERIYRNGMTTTSGGNLSILDPAGDIWITPGGVDKGSLTRADIMCIKADDSIEGHHKPSIETSLHLAAYKARINIKAVLHAHSPALSAFCMLHQLPDFRLIPNTRIVCGKITFAEYAMMGTEQLAQLVGKEFAEGAQAVIMENHGVVVSGESMAQAYRIFETLEFAARSELLSRRLGAPNKLTEDEIDIARTRAHTRLSEFNLKYHSSKELGLRREISMLIQRGLQQQLFYSSQGTISTRVDKNTFLITPFGMDRREINEENIVLVKKGLKEAGKVPSRAVFLHELIYHRNPHIQAIVAAQPPHIMAYTITKKDFDATLMPEPYVLLHDLPRAPYGLNYTNPQQTADLFKDKISSVLLENDGIITTGKSLTQAFDRMEVAEFTAKASLYVAGMEELKPLTKDKIEELDANFNF